MYLVAVAARLTGVEERKLRYAVARGAIPHVPIPGTRFKQVTLEDVEAWKNDPDAHKPGPKKKSD